ncbi:MAG: TrkA family potassium uptake protein [Erysipelotrichaceae bacterium]|nr:TrkA family potassium uptake protein [Erysipelotrichaceae bacterium]
MKIVIADGYNEADYMISLFNNRHNELIVINEDEDTCRYLSQNNNIPVMYGRCTRFNELEEAHAENADLFIVLSNDDYKNYVACKTAKQLFGVKRCIATVANPKNVTIFKQLGIDSAVCSTYLLGQRVKDITSVDNLISSLSIEDDKIIIVELVVTNDLEICGKTIADINIAAMGNISSVIHDGNALIPNGQTVMNENDRILIVTTHENKNRILNILRKKKK